MINITVYENLDLNIYDKLLKKKELKKVVSTVIKAVRELNPNYKMRKLPNPEDYNNTKGIIEVNIGDYNSSGMHIYGANVTLMRAVPDIIDGFKPLERRILYATAYISNAIKKKKKVLAIVGSVAFIHPHGDTSIGDAFISMSKPWENAYPLIEIKGNNGQPTGTRAAAPRYLEGRISDYCYDCYFSEWDDNIIEMVQSYNPEYMEPEYMISKYPNILLRPVTGFTFSVSTDFPSFNMTEAFNSVINLIKNRDYEPVLYPDFPCGCTIIDENQFESICKTGNGTFKMKSNAVIDYNKNEITITSLPYKVSMETVINKLIELNKNNVIPKLSNFHDYSDIYGVKLVLVFKSDTDLNKALTLLYNKTPLMSTYSTHMVFVDNYELKNVNLKYVMQKWIDNRRIIKRKVHIFRRNKLLARNHILQVLIDITSSEKKSVDMIRAIRVSTTDEIINKLMNTYTNISSLQAKEIANLKVKEFSVDTNKKFILEYENNKKEIVELNKVIDSQDMIDKIIIEELESAIGRYSKNRRSKIEKAIDKYNKDENNREYLIVATSKGRIKKLTEENKGVGELNCGDDPIYVSKMSNSDKLIIFDKDGFIHSLKINKVDEVDLKDKGIHIGKYINIDTEIVSIFNTNFNEQAKFLFVTKNGFIKKTSCTKYNIKSTSSAINLKDDDKLVDVKIINSENYNILIYTKRGIGKLLSIEQIKETQNRSSYGTLYFEVQNGDSIIGGTIIKDGVEYSAILTSKGNGKIIRNTFKRDSLYTLIRLSNSEEVISILNADINSEYIITTNKKYFKLNIESFPLIKLSSSGNKIIELSNNEIIQRFNRIR